MNGQGEIFLNGRSIGRARIRPVAGTPSNARRGILRAEFWVRVSSPLGIDGRFQIYDRAGHQSNALEFALAIGEARRDLPQQRADQDLFEAEIESATAGD